VTPVWKHITRKHRDVIMVAEQKGRFDGPPVCASPSAFAMLDDHVAVALAGRWLSGLFTKVVSWG